MKLGRILSALTFGMFIAIGAQAAPAKKAAAKPVAAQPAAPDPALLARLSTMDGQLADMRTQLDAAKAQQTEAAAKLAALQQKSDEPKAEPVAEPNADLEAAKAEQVTQGARINALEKSNAELAATVADQTDQLGTLNREHSFRSLELGAGARFGSTGTSFETRATIAQTFFVGFVPGEGIYGGLTAVNKRIGAFQFNLLSFGAEVYTGTNRASAPENQRNLDVVIEPITVNVRVYSIKNLMSFNLVAGPRWNIFFDSSKVNQAADNANNMGSSVPASNQPVNNAQQVVGAANNAANQAQQAAQDVKNTASSTKDAVSDVGDQLQKALTPTFFVAVQAQF